jgi:hypothetical protein
MCYKHDLSIFVLKVYLCILCLKPTDQNHLRHFHRLCKHINYFNLDCSHVKYRHYIMWMIIMAIIRGIFENSVHELLMKILSVSWQIVKMYLAHVVFIDIKVEASCMPISQLSRNHWAPRVLLYSEFDKQ